MALPTGVVSKLIEILNNRDKGGGLKEYKGGKTATPTGRSNEFSYAGGLDSYLQEAQRRGLDVSNVKSADELQGRIYDSLMSSKEGQDVIKGMWKDYGDTLKGSGKVLPKNLSEQDLTNLRSSFVDNKLGARTQMILERIPQKPPQAPPQTPTQAPPQAPPQMGYEGSPVYLPGVKGAIPGGTSNITSALVGFMSRGGEYTPIRPEDYQKYAVPQWAQEKMARNEEDEYLRTVLGAGRYKGRKK